jgi:hypothetical protein
VYYARYIGTTTFHLYDTYAHAIDLGSTDGRIDTSGTQSGVHVVCDPRLINKMLKGGAVMNITEASRSSGISMSSTNATYFGLSTGYVDYVIVDGVYGNNVTPRLFTNYTTASVSSQLKNSLWSENTTIDISFNFNYLEFVMENVHVNNLSVADGFGATGRNMTIKNVTLKAQCGTTALFFNGTNNLMEDFVITGYDASGYCGIVGVAHTWKDGMVIGVSICPNGAYGITFDNVTQQLTSAQVAGLYVVNSSVEAKNCTFGIGTTNAVADICYSPEVFSQIVATNCKIGSMGFDTVTYPITNTTEGTYFRFADYNQTANDDRSWETFGFIQRTGDGLTDTTVHTAGSGKFAIRLESSSADRRLRWTFPVPTGNISGKDMMIGVWCKINNAAYYAGTKEMPRLTVDYDNGTEVYAEAAQSTDWQFLSVPFSHFCVPMFTNIILTLHQILFRNRSRFN